MKTKQVAVALCAVVLPCAAPCWPQAPATTQEQIAAHTRKAQEYLHENKPALAIPEFQAIVALDPNNVDAQGNLGVMLYFQGHFTDAIPHLGAALKLQPSLSKIQALLGMAEKRTGDLDNAIRDLNQSFPNLTEKKVRIEVGTDLIDAYSSTGDLDKAASVVGALRDLDPTNIEILYTAYRIYSDLTDEARLSLMLVGPQSARTHQMMAHELARQGNTKEAIANYNAAIQLDPKVAGLHYELAEMLRSSAEAGGNDAAEKEYKTALRLNPLDEKSECRLGDLASLRGDTKEAQARYTRALQLQPGDAEANLGLAKVLITLHQSQQALPLLEKAVKLDPTNAVAHFRLSTVYRQLGRTEDAKRELEQYQKYKDMKEKLRGLYRQMRLEPEKKDVEDDARQ